MKKKGAIGLSVNILVMVIISLVILAGGVALLYKFIGSAEDIKSQLDQKTDERLESLLVDQGKQVALPFNSVTIQRGDSHIFGLGILNTKDKEIFNIEIEFKRAFAPDKNVGFILSPSEEIALKTEVESWLLYDDQPFTLKENQHKKEPISVTVPDETALGRYTLFINVKRNGQNYGNPQFITITVI